MRNKLLLRTTISYAAFVLFTLSGAVFAGEPVVAFSADMVQIVSGHDPIPGKLYVSEGKIRSEVGSGEKRRVTIEDLADKKIFLVLPAQKSYKEVPWPDGKKTSARKPLPGDPDHLCAVRPELKCKMLVGEEEVLGRKAEKWEIIGDMPLPSARSSGKVETVPFRVLVWVDRKLGANVKEERFVNGKLQGSSELRAIKDGPQPAEIFQIPEDYQRFEAPVPSSPPSMERNK